ncbi:NAD(P)H-quinone oxidoreductase [Halomonas sp. HMF6819]|uniref:NAD(P)H-quinone oxidoreductase n=1 Tax=Halomonas sp. HMF6819 TaxID=3373085 RepID=UPI0037982C6C
MHAIVIEDGQPSWQPVPELISPAAGEVVIKVAWAGVNRADLMQRAGHYPPPQGASDILGLEVSGVIVEIGEGVEHLNQGDKVCALLEGGGYAEKVKVDARQVLPLPVGFDLRQGAALMEAFATAWLNVFMLGLLSEGERVLIHAGASGVGTAAIQLCSALQHPCFVTVGSDEKLAFCRELGADAGHNRHQGSFVDAVKAWGGADLILDPVGAGYLPDNQRVLNMDGRLVLIGLMEGRKAELDMGRLLMKRQRLIGSTLRSKSPEAKGDILAELALHVWPRLENGEIKPLIDSEYAITDVEAAHQHMTQNASSGKLLLKIGAL